MWRNKRALHDYQILEELEAGLVLEGWEAKALRTNGISLDGSHCVFKDGELFLLNAGIQPTAPIASGFGKPDPLRTRKLLLSKADLSRLLGKAKEKGLTLVPLSVYRQGRRFKVGIALCKGKTSFDKRETDKARSIDLDLRRSVSSQKLAGS